MALLRKPQSEGTSYLELAQFIRTQGDAEHADADLEQLFRRVAFHIAVGNRDDHVRNHGFVLGKTGWKLAPAFDVNPNIDKTEQVLNIDDVDNRPSLETILSSAAFYALDDVQAQKIMNEVVIIVDQWQDAARWIHTSGANIVLTAGAFSANKA
jgi:serine/threonine-protein kinase HipA